jgi:hypothetical protein
MKKVVENSLLGVIDPDNWDVCSESYLTAHEVRLNVSKNC